MTTLDFELAGYNGVRGPIKGKIYTDGHIIEIFFEGYGTYNMEDGFGSLIFIENYRKHLSIIVFPDINDGDATIVDLESARESLRLP